MPQRVGYMLQKDLLLPWRTALGNVTLGLELQKLSRAERAEKAQGLLRTIGLASFYDYYPSALSGGPREIATRTSVSKMPRNECPHETASV